MGYESKLYIVKKHTALTHNEKFWGEVIVAIDMCKCFPLCQYFVSAKDTECYFYGFDGDNEINEDAYGDSIKELSLIDTIKILKDIMKDKENTYCRFNVLLKVLEAIKKEATSPEDFAVLHYGY